MTDAEQAAWLSLTAVLSAACSTVPLHVALRSLAGLYGALVGNLAASHPDLARTHLAALHAVLAAEVDRRAFPEVQGNA